MRPNRSLVIVCLSCNACIQTAHLLNTKVSKIRDPAFLKCRSGQGASGQFRICSRSFARLRRVGLQCPIAMSIVINLFSCTVQSTKSSRYERSNAKHVTTQITFCLAAISMLKSAETLKPLKDPKACFGTLVILQRVFMEMLAATSATPRCSRRQRRLKRFSKFTAARHLYTQSIDA